MHRRRFLDLSLTGVALNAALYQCAADAPPISTSIEGENLVDWIHRVRGEWDEDLYKKMLGSANDFKEGDAIVGVGLRSGKSPFGIEPRSCFTFASVDSGSKPPTMTSAALLG